MAYIFRKKRVCEVCGVEYVVRTGNQQYCSPTCAKTVKKQRRRKDYHIFYERAKKVKKTQAALAKVAQEADDHGLTYGQYIARQMMRRVNDQTCELPDID